MKNEIEMVRDFMDKSRQPIRLLPTKPSEISDDENSLRFKLVYEETHELSDAIIANDLCEIFDGLCDSLYVLLGTAHTYGLGQLLPLGFAEVHRSNMTKLWSAADAELVRHIKTYDITKIDEDQYLVKSNGKVLKPRTYSPPNLKWVLEKAIGQGHFNFNEDASALTDSFIKQLNLDIPLPETGVTLIEEDLEETYDDSEETDQQESTEEREE